MSQFWNLTYLMLKRKNHFAYWLILVQILTIIILPIIFLANGTAHNWKEAWNYFPLNLLLPVFDLSFAGIMVWQNEKINNSQSWHLPAIKDGFIWISNIFSSLLSCTVVFFSNLIVMFVFIKWDLFADLDAEAFLDLVFIVAVTLLIFAFSSFCNYFSSIASNYLPVQNIRWVKIFIFCLLVIVGVYLFFIINDHLSAFLIRNMLHKSAASYTPLWLTTVIVGGVALIFSCLDIFLSQKYVETNISNY